MNEAINNHYLYVTLGVHPKVNMGNLVA